MTNKEIMRKVACGLRQIQDSMIQHPLQARKPIQDWSDRVGGFARELEDATNEPG
jgi:hypothetical protein